MSAQITQQERLLQALKYNPAGVALWRIIAPEPMGGLGIAQYNARISELREQGHDIRTKKGPNGGNYFILIPEGQQELFDVI